MAIFRNYSSGLLKLLCVCVLIILCVLPTCKDYSVIFLSYVSAKGFIFKQFCVTTYQSPCLIMHGAVRNNSFDGILKVRERWKCLKF